MKSHVVLVEGLGRRWKSKDLKQKACASQDLNTGCAVYRNHLKNNCVAIGERAQWLKSKEINFLLFLLISFFQWSIK